MSLLTQQLEQLNKQKLNLEKRIEEEKQKKIKLDNTSSIERLEALVQPLTEYLNMKQHKGYNGNVPILGPSRREQLEMDHQHKIQNYNNRLIASPPTPFEQRIPPIKNEKLVKEEIYTTIIGILKNLQKIKSSTKN